MTSGYSCSPAPSKTRLAAVGLARSTDLTQSQTWTRAWFSKIRGWLDGVPGVLTVDQGRTAVRFSNLELRWSRQGPGEPSWSVLALLDIVGSGETSRCMLAWGAGALGRLVDDVFFVMCRKP